jgi:nucleoporin NUP2
LLAEGQGEEGEETAHEVRARLYILDKDAPGEVKWKDSGVGVFKVKRHTESGRCRLLGRNTTNGKVMLVRAVPRLTRGGSCVGSSLQNFALYAGLKITAATKTLSFLALDGEGKPLSVRLRMKDEGLATGLKEAIEAKVPAA